MSTGTKLDANDPDLSREMRFKTKTHASYSLGSFFDDFLYAAFSIRVYAFYETEVLLPNIFLATAIVIYGLWNMFNDPLIGYISEIPTRFTRRWGKRFPWFLFTAIPTAMVFAFIFSPPNATDWGTFFYLLIIICVYDFLFSFWNTNWMATFPVKFRSQRERTKVAAFQTIFSMVGMALGMLLPPFFFTPHVRGSYGVMGLVISLICVVVVILMMPSMRDDPTTHEMTMKGLEVQQSHPSYLPLLKNALKNKNYVSYLFAYLGQTVIMSVLLASVPYIRQNILLIDDPLYETYISAMVLIGGLCMIPVWIKIARKYGNRIGYMCGPGLSAVVLCFFMFIIDFTSAMVGAFVIGMTTGASWCLMYPALSDVIDEISVKAGKRNEGIYYGFRTFIGRLSIVIQAITFGVIHSAFGFVAGSDIQSDLAIVGLRIQFAIVPMIFYAIGFIAMWRFNDLKPAKVAEIKKQLEKLGI